MADEEWTEDEQPKQNNLMNGLKLLALMPILGLGGAHMLDKVFGIDLFGGPSTLTAAAGEAVPPGTGTATRVAAADTAATEFKRERTCVSEIARAAALACEFTVVSTLYPNYTDAALMRIRARATSDSVQQECPHSGQMIANLHSIGSERMLRQMAPGWNSIDAQGQPSDFILTRCMGEIASGMSEVPGMFEELSSFNP